MATLTTSWQSFASASFSTGSSTVVFYLEARYTSQSVSNNTTNVQTRLRSDLTSGYISGAGYNFTCTYASTVSGSGVWNFGDEVITSGSSTVKHNNDGTKTLSLSATAYNKYWNFTKTLSASVSIPKINRLANVTGGTDFNDETNPKITFTNPAGYQVLPYLNFYYNGQILVHLERTKGNYTSPYTWELTAQERQDIRDTITMTSTINIVEGLETYNGNTKIGASSLTRKFTFINANPTFDADYEDTNSTTTAITGDNQLIVQNHSTLEINGTDLSAKKSATLSSIVASINGVNYNGTISGTTATINVGTINVAEDIDAIITLTDSRGLTKVVNLPLTILSYSQPTASITLARENNFYSTTNIKVEANYSSLDSHNTITIKTRYKKTTDVNYGAYVTLTDGVTSQLTLDNNYQWDVQVLVQDSISSTTYNLTLDRGIPIVFFDRLKRSTGINCIPNNTESLEVLGGDILDIIGDKTDTWESGTSYAKDDFVTYERYIYKNKTGTNNTAPDTDTTNWEKVSILELMKDIEASGGGGTTNYNDLGNKPSINNVTLSGNKTTSDLGIVIPTNTNQLTNGAGFITNTVNDLTNYTLSSALATVATSGNYDNLTNRPQINGNTLTGNLSTSDLGITIPTVNNGKLTIGRNGTKLNDFYANSSSNVSVDISVPVEDVQINGTSILSNKEANIRTNSTYNSSTNKIATMSDIPTVPTTVSSFTNDAGYITGINSSDVTTALGFTPQEEITSTNKLDYSLIDNTPTIGNAKTYYGVCNTGAYVGTKEVTISDFVLETGAIVTIKFTYGNEYTNTPLLKINNNEAKYLKIASNTLTYKFGNNSTKSFVYDGSDFILIEPSPANSSNYGLVKTSTSVSSTSTTDVATSSAVKQAYDLADSKQDKITNSNKLDYSLISNTPTIPTKTSDLINDSNFVDTSYHDSTKQDTLVSGTNIKTINNTSLLGSGNINISGGGTATDVQINGTSITSSGTANILTNGTYSSSNKIATMADLPSVPVQDVQINGTSIVSSGEANLVTNTAYDSTSNKIATMSDIPTPNIMTAYLKADYAIPNTNTIYSLTNMEVAESVGSKLSLSSGKIVIGAGVSKVKVSYTAKVVSNANTTRTFTYLIQETNGVANAISQEGYWYGATNWQVVNTYGPRVVSVNQGDQFYINCYGYKNNAIAGATSTFMPTIITVEVIE